MASLRHEEKLSLKEGKKKKKVKSLMFLVDQLKNNQTATILTWLVLHVTTKY